MSYAVIEDVPASWERYEVIARAVVRRPRGLLLHVAGPTEEGFRIIEIWESEEAWQAFAHTFHAALETVDPAVGTRAVGRDLRAVHLVQGEAWDSGARIRADPSPRGVRAADAAPGREQE